MMKQWYWAVALLVVCLAVTEVGCAEEQHAVHHEAAEHEHEHEHHDHDHDHGVHHMDPHIVAKQPSKSLAGAFMSSWLMILASEIGDKTFFIACLLAMRNDRLTVFWGAISALAAMTILSAAMGYIVPSFLPVKYTRMAAVVLFLVFGARLVNEARQMEDTDEDPEELTEAQAVLTKKEEDYGMDAENPMDPVVTVHKKTRRHKGMASVFGPVFIQAFTLTFVAEWGDRSQIMTVVLAAVENPYAVTIGGILGHSICTGSAVILGKAVSTKFTPRHVTWFGGILFLIFGILTAYDLYHEYDHPHHTK